MSNQMKGENNMKATNIEWDTDGDMELLEELPKEMELPDGMTNEDEISDWLSDQTGFCHDSFCVVD